MAAPDGGPGPAPRRPGAEAAGPTPFAGTKEMTRRSIRQGDHLFGAAHAHRRPPHPLSTSPPSPAPTVVSFLCNRCEKAAFYPARLSIAYWESVPQMVLPEWVPHLGLRHHRAPTPQPPKPQNRKARQHPAASEPQPRPTENFSFRFRKRHFRQATQLKLNLG